MVGGERRKKSDRFPHNEQALSTSLVLEILVKTLQGVYDDEGSRSKSSCSTTACRCKASERRRILSFRTS